MAKQTVPIADGTEQKTNMDSQLENLLSQFSLRQGKVDDLASFVRRTPDADSLPVPWVTWTLIGLVRHRPRQQWVADIVRFRLKGDLQELAKLGSLGHPDNVASRGPLPGMPEWEYYFHGRGCCLTHKVEGQSIDVDFWDESGDYFDTFFYKNYLQSLRKPELAEQRLLKLHPSGDTVTLAIDWLMKHGALQRFEDRHAFRLTDQVLAFVDDIEAFCEAWNNSKQRPFLAASIGDWLALQEHIQGTPTLETVVHPRAERCGELWEQMLIEQLSEKFKAGVALRALADRRSTGLDNHLSKALAGPPSGKVVAALEILNKTHTPKRWCNQVYKLFTSVTPNDDLPAPRVWMHAAIFLIEHDHKREQVLSSLKHVHGTEIGEAVLVSLKHAPQLTLSLVRKGLLSDIPMGRTQVAAILCLINQPWSKQELLEVLKISDDQAKTADARAALLELCDPIADQAVMDWEERFPHEDAVGTFVEINGRKLGPFYTLGEVSFKNRAAYLKYEMQELHDRVMPLRQVVPIGNKKRRPWWKLW